MQVNKRKKEGVDRVSTPSLRMKRLIVLIFAGLAMGLGYALWIWRTSLAIPCLIRTQTGFYCPGCGVTGMCLALLQLDFATAYAMNPYILTISPIIAYLMVDWGISYVKMGGYRDSKLKNVLIFFCIILGVIRTVQLNFG